MLCPRRFTAGRFPPRSPVSDNTDRKMLENFVKINQFPRLVKQQLGSLFRYFSGAVTKLPLHF
jgi:hypothetical protein